MIRHAIAEPREESPGDDEELRPLNDRGRRRMRLAARGLSYLVPELDVLAASPLLRAGQTAEILAKELVRCPPPTVIEELTPGAASAGFLSWLERQEPAARVAVVGHEPSLSLAASWLLSGLDRSLVAFKKGGAALLTFDGAPASAGARLLWLLTPGQLRRIARGGD